MIKEGNKLSKEDIAVFIQENGEDDDFTGGVSDETINEIEYKLEVKFPNSYKWFLRNYGSGGIYGVDILGCGKSSNPSVLSNTERFRNLGLPKQYIVIGNCDEFVYCLDTSDFNDMECSIISWDRISGYNGEREDNFYEFYLNRLIEAKENWDEDF